MNLRCGGRASEKEVQLSTKGTERGEASKEERRDERNCRKAMRRIQQRFFPRRNKLEASVRVGPQSDVAEAKRTRPCAEHTLKAFFRPSASIDGANLHVIRSSGLHVIRSHRHVCRIVWSPHAPYWKQGSPAINASAVPNGKRCRQSAALANRDLLLLLLCSCCRW